MVLCKSVVSTVKVDIPCARGYPNQSLTISRDPNDTTAHQLLDDRSI